MHRAFISYHHANDQDYKNWLVRFGEDHEIFSDWSVDTGDISEHLDDQTIRRTIRDDYLRSSTVTILLVGTETKFRKHVDWELYSSMINGTVNKRSGILVINLPSTGCTCFTAAHGEHKIVYPEYTSWTAIDQRSTYEERYPYMPPRIIDNLLAPKAKISVTNWNTIEQHPEKLAHLISVTAADRTTCEYNLSRPMRGRNHSVSRVA